jgi:hypothetical protein
MYPIYLAPIAQCEGAAPGASTSAHTATVRKTTKKAHKHHAASKARKH